MKKFYEKKPTKIRFGPDIQNQFIIKVNLLIGASNLQAVYALAGSLHYEKLKEKKYLGKYSIRLNKQRRVIIDQQNKTEITLILEEITDYH